MKTLTLSRQELYTKVWNEPITQLCQHFDVPEEGFEEICRRLNVPIPENNHWKKMAQGKKPSTVQLPQQSTGVESVTLFLKDDESKKAEYTAKLDQLAERAGVQSIQVDQNIFDRLVFSTAEGMFKHWEIRNEKYREKNKLLAVHVSAEKFARGLIIMDLFIKLMRARQYDVIVEKGGTHASIDGERIQVSIHEKNSRAEYFDEYKRLNKINHPNGCLFMKKDGSSWDKKEWKDGRILLEDQIPTIIDDLVAIAQQQKEQRAKMKRAQEEREEQARIKHEFEKRQKVELDKFRQLLLDAHRFSLSNLLRNYIDEVEKQATAQDKLTDETRGWISWAREKTDWFDPSIKGNPDDLLDGIDLESLKSRSNSFGYYSPSVSTEQTRDNFWKPWWSR